MTFEDWKIELVQIASKSTGTDMCDIKINDQEAKVWYESGWTPYFTFRENWQ